MCAVKPVLDELGFTEMPASRTCPRVWWVRSGLLNVLPIHAAGCHNSNPPQTALDRVISSYASTMKSLLYARERAMTAGRIEIERAVLYAMPSTLPFALSEAQDLENILTRASINTETVSNPINEEVRNELLKYSIVHFACHGKSMSDPSESRLLLQDKPLTVSHLTSLKIEPAKFAYLSACHTASMRELDLLDESINLSSAVQLYGYPSVVGTMWHVNDEHSAKVASDVYTWISNEKNRSGFNAQRSAEGLHKAVRELRNRTRFKDDHDPIAWAPFIHIGI